MLSWLLKTDYEVFRLINSQLTSAAWDPLMRLLSSLYLGTFLIGVVVFFAIYRKNWRFLKLTLLVLLIVIVADLIAYQVFKPFFGRPRPCKDLGYIRLVAEVGCGGFLGFPSNHATNSMVVATSMMIFAKWWIGICAFFVALWIGFSRIYLGVHYPLDVAAGYLFGGIFSLVVCLSVRKKFPLQVTVLP